MDKACKNCMYFYQVTERAGECHEDMDSPVYPKVDEWCDQFTPKLQDTKPKDEARSKGSKEDI